jgi:hypothetical protein
MLTMTMWRRIAWVYGLTPEEAEKELRERTKAEPGELTFMDLVRSE